MISKPLVIRLKGTFEKEANEMLELFRDTKEESLRLAPLIIERELEQAAIQAVKIAAEAELSQLVQI